MIIWISGISGSGKTTVAQGIITKYKKILPHLINVDGDLVREFFGEQLPYDESSRIQQIQRNLLQGCTDFNTSAFEFR